MTIERNGRVGFEPDTPTRSHAATNAMMMTPHHPAMAVTHSVAVIHPHASVTRSAIVHSTIAHAAVTAAHSSIMPAHVARSTAHGLSSDGAFAAVAGLTLHRPAIRLSRARRHLLTGARSSCRGMHVLGECWSARSHARHRNGGKKDFGFHWVSPAAEDSSEPSPYASPAGKLQMLTVERANLRAEQEIRMERLTSRLHR